MLSPTTGRGLSDPKSRHLYLIGFWNSHFFAWLTRTTSLISSIPPFYAKFLLFNIYIYIYIYFNVNLSRPIFHSYQTLFLTLLGGSLWNQKLKTKLIPHASVSSFAKLLFEIKHNSSLSLAYDCHLLLLPSPPSHFLLGVW